MVPILIACIILNLTEGLPQPAYSKGISAHNVKPNIIGGSQVSISDYPYQASLQYTSGAHQCGTSILSTTKLVSAAHCTQLDPATYQVRAGSSDYNSGGQLVLVSSIVNHEDYTASAGNPNDVSTIRLASILVFDSTVQQIPLASSGDYEGALADATGWGSTSATSSVPSDLLQGLTRKVISNQECANRMYSVHNGNIYDSHLCTYGPQTSGATCYGDDGGPLASGGELIGISSWEVSECLTTYPSVYSRVTYYRDWINNN